MKRALVVCPGRGSYDRGSLGVLQGRAAPILDACDAARAARGLPTVRELDAAETFRGSLHVAGEHASLLTFACSLADLHDLDRSRYEVVGVVGNSMGWYTALAAAGALSDADAITLVETLGGYQAGNVLGGQVLYPVWDADWRPDPARLAHVEGVLHDARLAGHVVEWSIRLGGHAVLGGDAGGVRFLLEHLDPVAEGSRSYPVQLPLHSAFHTSVMAETAARAQAELDLAFRAPAVPLVDGRGFVHMPRWADPAELRAWTLGDQITRTFDFTLAVEAALTHTVPDVVVALGPGNALGGPLARILVANDWAGAGSKEALEHRDDPILLSFGVPGQRARLVAS